MIQVFNVLKKYKLNGYNYSENPRDFTYKKSILCDKDIVEYLVNRSTLREWASLSL